jgi:hypothetical protein
MNDALSQLAKQIDDGMVAKPNGPADEAFRAMATPRDEAELPPARARAVEAGLAQFQQIAHERDELHKQVAALKDRIAALEIEAEGLRTQLNDALSQITTAHLVRDQALADRIKYEALFISMWAQMRAFAVPAAPLIKDADTTGKP